MIRSLLIVFSLLHLAACDSVSLAQATAFASQRPCAQSCFGGGIFGDVGELADGIGCAYQNPQNECVCRLDLQSNADEYIASCVSRYCSANTLDITSAVSIYDAYCTSAGYVRDTPATRTSDSSTSAPSSPSSSFSSSSSSSQSQPQQTTFTSQSSSSISSNSVEDSSSQGDTSKTEAPAPTDSASGGSSNDGEGSNGGSNSSGGGNGLGVGDIVGIVIGVLGFIATAIGTWFTYKSIIKKKPSRYSGHVERGW